MADSLREQIARAMSRKRVLENLKRDRRASESEAWIERCVDYGYRDLLPDANNVIAAIEAAGFVIVPVEPTEEMQEAGGNCGGFEFDGNSGTIWPAPIYRAMVAARPEL